MSIGGWQLDVEVGGIHQCPSWICNSKQICTHSLSFFISLSNADLENSALWLYSSSRMQKIARLLLADGGANRQRNKNALLQVDNEHSTCTERLGILVHIIPAVMRNTLALWYCNIFHRIIYLGPSSTLAAGVLAEEAKQRSLRSRLECGIPRCLGSSRRRLWRRQTLREHDDRLEGRCRGGRTPVAGQPSAEAKASLPLPPVEAFISSQWRE
jgi:hypothetical protein